MNALVFALLAAVPAGEDQPVTIPLTGPASARFAAPVSITFDPSITGDTTLVKADGSTRAGTTPDAIAAIARSAPAVARRHFEDAKWNDAANTRSIVVKSVTISWREGPSYEVHVEVERRDGDKRLGVAQGTGYGTAQRNNAQRTGAAYANMFGAKAKNGLTEANPATDGEVIRTAALQGLDGALYQLSAVWAGEQMMQKAREDAEAAMKKAQDAQKKPAAKAKK
jgi:hypothetical protein